MYSLCLKKEVLGLRFRPVGLRFRPVGLLFRPQSFRCSVLVLGLRFRHIRIATSKACLLLVSMDAKFARRNVLGTVLPNDLIA